MNSLVPYDVASNVCRALGMDERLTPVTDWRRITYSTCTLSAAVGPGRQACHVIRHILDPQLLS